MAARKPEKTSLFDLIERRHSPALEGLDGLVQQALAQREIDRLYTREQIDIFLDVKEIYSAELLLQLCEAREDEEPLVREAAKRGLGAGVQRFLDVAGEPCCIYHADREAFQNSQLPYEEVFRHVMSAAPRCAPKWLAKEICGCFATRVYNHGW